MSSSNSIFVSKGDSGFLSKSDQDPARRVVKISTIVFIRLHLEELLLNIMKLIKGLLVQAVPRYVKILLIWKLEKWPKGRKKIGV